MTSPPDELKIRCAIQADEIAAGLAFVNHQYQKSFGVIPSPPDHLLVARRGLHIVGTIGLNVWNAETGLRLVNLYEFNHSQVRVPIDLPASVEFARWACESNGVACALLHAATCLSLTLGKNYAWCEHSLAVNRICRKYGIIFHSVTDAHRKAALIEKHHRAFYDSIDARLFVFNLAQARPALESYMKTHP